MKKVPSQRAEQAIAVIIILSCFVLGETHLYKVIQCLH